LGYARDLLDCVRGIRPEMGRWSHGKDGELRERLTSRGGDVLAPAPHHMERCCQHGPVITRAMLPAALFSRLLRAIRQTVDVCLITTEGSRGPRRAGHSWAPVGCSSRGNGCSLLHIRHSTLIRRRFLLGGSAA